MSDSLKLDIFRCLARLAYTEPGAERLADPGLVSGLASTLAGNCQCETALFFFFLILLLLILPTKYYPLFSFGQCFSRCAERYWCRLTFPLTSIPPRRASSRRSFPPLAEAFRTDASETKWEYMDVLTRCLEMSSVRFSFFFFFFYYLFSATETDDDMERSFFFGE
jgi:hypothetical protein